MAHSILPNESPLTERQQKAINELERLLEIAELHARGESPSESDLDFLVAWRMSRRSEKGASC